MSGKTTSTLDRPATPPSAADRGRSRLGDLSRPIQIDRRISRTRRTNVLLAMAAVAIAAALAAAIFVLPVKTLFNQDEQIAERTDQLTQMQVVNEDLRSEVARLRTDDGVREAAREQLGFVEEGEIRQSILDFPPVPTDLPDGWPYSLFEGIVTVRVAASDRCRGTGHRSRHGARDNAGHCSDHDRSATPSSDSRTLTTRFQRGPAAWVRGSVDCHTSYLACGHGADDRAPVADDGAGCGQQRSANERRMAAVYTVGVTGADRRLWIAVSVVIAFAALIGWWAVRPFTHSDAVGTDWTRRCSTHHKVNRRFVKRWSATRSCRARHARMSRCRR